MARRRGARGRRRRGAPTGRAGARRRQGGVHGRRPPTGDAPCRRAARARARTRASHRPRRRRGARQRPAFAQCSHRSRRSRSPSRRRSSPRRSTPGSRSRSSPPTRRSTPQPDSPRSRPSIEPLPHVVDPDEALREQRFTRDPFESTRGDVDEALAGADVDGRARARDARPPPDAARAARRGRRVERRRADRLGLDARDVLALGTSSPTRFGLRRDQVRVIAAFIGGGFGAKQGAGVEALLAAELARQTGRPVRLVNDRHAEQLDGGRRAWTRQSVRLGASRDGTPRRRRRGRARRPGSRRLGPVGARPRADAVPQRARARPDVPAPPQPADAERIPRARLRRGDRGLRAGDRRARAARSTSTRSSCAGATTSTRTS